METLVGQKLGRYQVASMHGEGGMGSIYLAYDPNLKRDVAIKVMHPHIARMQNFRERFLQEARIAAHLHHPNIVQVYDFGEEGWLLYIVMQFIQGDSMDVMLSSLRAQKKWIPLEEAIKVIRQLALALDYLHKQGVLHRDIKPGNIMIEPEPCEGLPFRPVLTDLGLAKLMEGGLTTQAGISVGTPAYMSPEQALGQVVDIRSDIYSLGVLLYELCVGQLPFPAKTISQAIHYHTAEIAPSPRSILPALPLAVEEVILKAMEKKPDDRFADAVAFAKALDICLPAASMDLQPTPTLANTVSLATEYQKGLGEVRGPSILEEFKTPPMLVEDCIQIMSIDKSMREVKMKPGGLTIGRSADNDVAVMDPNVSHHHARVSFHKDGYQITDMDSTNGTYLDNTKLLPGIPETWTSDKAVRIGGTWLRLLLARDTATGIIQQAGIKADSGEGREVLFIKDSELSVEPGQTITVPITMLNQSATVSHFRVSVSGIPAGWVKLPPNEMHLMPSQQETVALSIQPPRLPEGRAGAYVIIVMLTNQETAIEVARASLTLTITPFYKFSCEIQPQKIHTGKTARLAICNQGNAESTFFVEWKEQGDEFIFNPPHTRVPVPEGQTSNVNFRVRPRRWRWFGREQVYFYEARVRPSVGDSQVSEGQIVDKAILPPWLLPLLLLLLLAVCAALGAYIWKNGLPVPEPKAIVQPGILAPTNTAVPPTGTPLPPAVTIDPKFCPKTLPTRLAVGVQVKVSDTPIPNRLREAPGMSGKFLANLLPGESLQILEGPRCASDLIYWKVRSKETGKEGWTAEGDPKEYWLVPLP